VSPTGDKEKVGGTCGAMRVPKPVTHPSSRESAMYVLRNRITGFAVMQQVLFHAFVSVLAIGIAFSLPTLASFVLNDWWPRVSASSRLLLATELALAATLVILFNVVHLAWEGLRVRRLHDTAALVHVRRDGKSASRKGAPATHDALILSVTGHHTFAERNAPFHDLVSQCLEARVLLLNPCSEGARERIRSLPDPEEAERLYRQEIGASIAYLKALRDSGRRIRLKLYDRAPFWSIVIAGEQAWVRYCHDGYPLRTQPDYVFALRRDEPTQGLFPPFCMYALNQWNDPANAEYDFATGELVHRSPEGAELARAAFPQIAAA